MSVAGAVAVPVPGQREMVRWLERTNNADDENNRTGCYTEETDSRSWSCAGCWFYGELKKLANINSATHYGNDFRLASPSSPSFWIMVHMCNLWCTAVWLFVQHVLPSVVCSQSVSFTSNNTTISLIWTHDLHLFIHMPNLQNLIDETSRIYLFVMGFSTPEMNL